MFEYSGKLLDGQVSLLVSKSRCTGAEVIVDYGSRVSRSEFFASARVSGPPMQIG